MASLLALQLQSLLWRVHVVQSPRAELAIVADTDQIVGVLRADHLNAVDGMGVRGSGQRGSLDGRALVAAVVPHDYLAGVGARNDQVGVEVGEAAGGDPAGAVEDVLGRVGLELGVPD